MSTHEKLNNNNDRPEIPSKGDIQPLDIQPLDANCSWTKEQLSRHLDGELSESASARVSTHLDHCAACRQALASEEALLFATLDDLIPGEPGEDFHSRMMEQISAVPQPVSTPRKLVLPRESAIVAPASESSWVQAFPWVAGIAATTLLAIGLAAFAPGSGNPTPETPSLAKGTSNTNNLLATPGLTTDSPLNAIPSAPDSIARPTDRLKPSGSVHSLPPAPVPSIEGVSQGVRTGIVHPPLDPEPTISSLSIPEPPFVQPGPVSAGHTGSTEEAGSTGIESTEIELATAPPARVLGDLDGDGQNSFSDIRLLAKFVDGQGDAIPCQAAADFDSDAQLTPQDMVGILGAQLHGVDEIPNRFASRVCDVLPCDEESCGT